MVMLADAISKFVLVAIITQELDFRCGGMFMELWFRVALKNYEVLRKALRFVTTCVDQLALLNSRRDRCGSSRWEIHGWLPVY